MESDILISREETLERLKQCNNCECCVVDLIPNCTQCNCSISVLTTLKSKSCSVGKW